MSVPALRFKEFSGDWEKKTLELLCEAEAPITYGVLKPGDYFEGGTPLIQIKDLENGQIKQANLHLISPNLDNEYKRSRIQVNDILISLIGTIGRIALVSNTLNLANIHRNIGRIRTNFYNYVFHYLNSPFAVKKIELVSSGSSQSALNLTDLREIEIPIPSLPEQTKIANFLTAVDEKITLLTQKADLLSQYKKGVMQQIFSQELRFKDDDGQEFPEWEEKRLGDISILITKGTTPKRFSYEGINFIKIECFDGNLILKEKCAFIEDVTHQTELKRSILFDGDILFAIAGSIGKCNIVTADILPANTNQALAIVRLKENENRKYIYHLLSSYKMQKYIGDNISVGAQPNLNLEQMGNFNINYPSLPEQNKIANFLTAIDEKITTNQTQLNAVKQYKQGLLQQMFV